MKKILSLILVLAMSLVMFSFACAEGETYRVAYIARAQADSFAAWLANAVKEEADKYDNITVEVFDGQASDETENGLIENAITNQFDCIIIQPNNGEAQRPYAEQVVAAGIVCITTNARIDGVEGASSVDADPYEQAAVNARMALEVVPEGATAVILRGPAGNFHADERLKAWQTEFFDKRPDVTVVGDDYANWNKDEAMTLMEDWVTAASEPIGLIASMNDNMAAGALEVIKDNPDYADVLSFGVDGTAEACLLIQEGRMTATCLQNAYELAELLLDTANKLLTGAEEQIDTDVGNPLYTIDNVQELYDIHVQAGAIS